MYRCIKSNTTDEVLAIGMDQNQSGEAYNGVGIWCDFTFDTIPTIPQEVITYAEQQSYTGNLHKVVGSTIVAKTIEDIN